MMTLRKSWSLLIEHLDWVCILGLEIKLEEHVHSPIDILPTCNYWKLGLPKVALATSDTLISYQAFWDMDISSLIPFGLLETRIQPHIGGVDTLTAQWKIYLPQLLILAPFSSTFITFFLYLFQIMFSYERSKKW